MTAVFGHPLAFSFAGLLVGSVIFSLPFAVQPVTAGFRSVDREILEAAELLSPSPARILARVLLPLVRPFLFTAAVLAFTHTVGEFGVVLMIGGSIPGVTRTLSISIYDQVQDFAYAQANHTALLLLSLSFLALLIIYGRRGRAGVYVYLQADIEHTLGDLLLRISCALSAPWTVLFGPSGAGKTSLLRVIGGLTKPDRGRVVLNGRTLVDTAREYGFPRQNGASGLSLSNPLYFPTWM